eukprot:3479831-Rhodomonas_salina.2
MNTTPHTLGLYGWMEMRTCLWSLSQTSSESCQNRSALLSMSALPSTHMVVLTSPSWSVLPSSQRELPDAPGNQPSFTDFEWPGDTAYQRENWVKTKLFLC